MFTGLIETTGTVRAVTPSDGGTRIIIDAPESLATRLRLGDSIAVSGVCLTALDLAPTHFAADLAQETLDRTTLRRLQAGSTVNLELPTPAGSPLGGHVVQGHVDGVATLLAMDAIHPNRLHTTDWRMLLELSPELARNVVSQGSITVEGISLTVALVRPNSAGPMHGGTTQIELAIIPHTWNSTSLRTLKPGAPVNIETDVLARYAAQQTAKRPAASWLTTAYLLANGY